MTTANTLSTVVDILAAPKQAFATIRDRAPVMVPLLLVCAFAAAANWLYLLEVDIAWLTEQQLRAYDFLDLTDAQIEQRANAAAERGRTLTIFFSVVGVFVVVTAIMLLQALYLKLVAMVRKDPFGFKVWLSLVCWTALPAILASLAAIVFILTNDVTFAGQFDINVLSFAKLTGMDLSAASSLARGMLSNLGPVNIWSLALLLLGHRQLTGAPFATSAAIVIVPILFFVAILVALF